MKASGDQRDWFRYGHRLQAHTRATHEFITGRRVRRDMSAKFNWNQILVLGDYGAGKTTTAIKLAYLYYRLGHPVFSNASCLFGWHLERSPNPPKDTDGRREESGRGVRELQGK